MFKLRPLLLAGLMCCAGGASGQEAPARMETSTTTGTGDSPSAPEPSQRLDAAELEAYVDGVVEAYMKRLGIAGVTVAVVDAQGPLLLRGYGIATQKAVPGRVRADACLFRIGSISKTFTYLEALKLIDAGRLDLDAPVNDYLPEDLALADDGYPPVRIRHLLTHTAGYEDSALGHLFARSPQEALSLHDYVLRHRPRRVREPGLHAVYSNYSLALLGAVLANVSGVPFEALMERELFEPMGMDVTTFREPLGEDDERTASAWLRDMWSEGFKRTQGGFEKQDFEYIAQLAPAGSASSTSVDMARYMRMLLGRGELDGKRILPASAFARLQGEPLFRTAPQATGFAYGFFRKRYGDVHSLEHGGATLYFHSNMVVVPELGFGVFVSTNTDTGVRLAAELPGLLLERYFPAARSDPPQMPAADEGEALAPYLGAYLGERRNYTRSEKLLLSTVVEVGATAGGHLTLSAGGETSRWARLSDDVFASVEGPGRLVFLRDGAGRVSGFVSPGGHDVFDRAGAFEVPGRLYALLALAGLAAVGVLAGAWLRRRRRCADAGGRSSARWLAFTALAWLLFLALFATAFVQISAAGDAAIFEYPSTLLRVALWAALPALLLTLASVALLWRAWRSKAFGLWRKLRHTLALTAFVLAGYGVWVWNMVGWKL